MKKFVVLMVFMLIFTIGGVSATWLYADVMASPVSSDVGMTLGVFEYSPEEILPGGGGSEPGEGEGDEPGGNEPEDVPIGENHYILINLILNHEDSKYGLNASDKAILHKYLEDQPIVFCNQKVSGGNLKHILNEQNNTDRLHYCLEKVSDTEYFAYTFSYQEMSLAAETSNEITVYRTTLVKTDIWRATTSFLGYSIVRNLSFFGVQSDNSGIPYSIDTSKWHM